MRKIKKPTSVGFFCLKCGSLTSSLRQRQQEPKQQEPEQQLRQQEQGQQGFGQLFGRKRSK